MIRRASKSYTLLKQCIPFPLIHTHSHHLRNFFSVQNYMKTYSADQITRTHGRIRVDQNAHICQNSQLQQFINKQKALYEKQSVKWETRMHEYLNRVNERKDQRLHSVGEIYNGYEYYTTVAWYQGRQYTHIWRKSLKNQRSQLVLDIMKYSRIRAYYKTVELIRTVFSPNSKYIAFGFDLHNNEEISFMIKNIDEDYIVGVKGWENNRLKGVDNIVFAGDNGIFYTKVTNFRPAELWYQNIKTGEAQMIYEQKNGEYYLDISMTKDQKHLIVNSNTRQDSKNWMINIEKTIPRKSTPYRDTRQSKNEDGYSKQTFQMKELKLSKKDTKIYINHNGKNFVVWKSSTQANQIVLLNQNNLAKQILIHKISPQSYETISDIDIFQNYIVLYMRKIVSPMVRIIELNGQQVKSIQQIPMPYEFGSVHPGANQMLKSKTFIFYVNNIFVYNEGYEYSFETKKITIKEEFKMSGPKFNTRDYLVTLHQVPTQDGQLVPLTTIVPRRNSKNRNKMLLHCYGHYGLAYEIDFNNNYWAALENGWSLAYAHVRGGGEKGQHWHKSAIKGFKYKNWTDLEDCVAYLIKNQFTHPNILILTSHSAGSITIWNTINRYPHLYKAVIMSYPFLDVLGSLLDSSKPLTQSDYAEFGNPNQNINTYNQIESISPYDNIQQGKSYPFIYLIAGTKDYRCPMDQIAKFANRYRQMRKWDESKQRFEDIGEKGLLIKINEGGHAGIADLGEQLKDGCQTLACMDYLIEEGSRDIQLIR